jgi:hypothetical protein
MRSPVNDSDVSLGDSVESFDVCRCGLGDSYDTGCPAHCQGFDPSPIGYVDRGMLVWQEKCGQIVYSDDIGTGKPEYTEVFREVNERSVFLADPTRKLTL